MTSPTQKGEREEALEAARRIVFAADSVSASDGGPRKAAIKRLNAETDNQYSVVRIARALISSSKAEGEVIPFDKTDLAQLQQVREELRNRWRASAWQLLCRTIDDLESRAALSPKEDG